MGLFSWLKRDKKTADPHRWLAMILRREAHPPIMDGLDAVYRDAFPKGPKLKGASQDAKDMWTLPFGSGRVTVAHMRSRISDEDTERASQLSWHWPEAGTAVSQHASHLIVFLDGVASDPMENARALTTFSSALTRQSAGTAIFWGAASLLHEPDRYHKMAEEVSKGQIPPMLWFSLAGSESDDGEKTVTTLGLEPFGLHDVELWTRGLELQQALEKVGDVGMYLLQKGAVFHDGDTFGYSPDDKTKVRITKSRVLNGKTMYVLEGK